MRNKGVIMRSKSDNAKLKGVVMYKMQVLWTCHSRQVAVCEYFELIWVEIRYLSVYFVSVALPLPDC